MSEFENPASSKRKRRRSRKSTRKFFKRFFGAVAFLLLAGLTTAAVYLVINDDEEALPVAELPSNDVDLATLGLRPVSLPIDHAPHDEPMEWWYYNGHLETQAGKKYGFHYTVFVVNTLVRHTVIHFSLIDLQSGQHFSYQAKTPGRVNRGGPTEFDFKYAGFQVRGGSGPDLLALSQPELRLQLKIRDTKPVHLHDEEGLLNFGTGGYTYYYTRPNLPLNGILELDGKPSKVTGTAWFDHQWGDFTPHDDGWDWFALQFEDGSSVMIFAIHDQITGEKMYKAGSWMTAKGDTINIDGESITLEPTKTWRSQATGREYPVQWRLKLSAPYSVDLRMKAIVDNAEYDARDTTTNIYWEGPVSISGDKRGRGYMELTGYK